MTILAHTIFPTKTLCMDEELYFRPNGSAWYSYHDKSFYLKEGGSVDFGTYFNSFSIGKWKRYCEISDLTCLVEGKGKFLVYLHHLSISGIDKVLDIVEVESKQVVKSEMVIPSTVQDGIVYIRCKALNDCALNSIDWIIKESAKNSVKLGLSITTFNRQEAVVSSSSRIKSFLENSTIDAHLLIVDNGKNVEGIEESSVLTLIPNENLGGSGGFARGLYYYKEQQEAYTHVLFMDDDASCETESIYRAYQLLSFAKEDNIAISGAMLLGNAPHVQWENGANFNEVCRPIKSGYNLHDKRLLVENEDDASFAYGGWWFFLFPIKNAEYPYPFFVRGDDVNFGLQKQFKQVSLNGIATWGDDFFYKESPLTQYLDMRSHLLHHIQVQSMPQSNTVLLRLFWRLFLKYTLTYKYASGQAQLEALKDVLKGPSFWAENIGMKEIFPKIGPLAKQEKLLPLEDDFDMSNWEYSHEYGLPRYHTLIKIIKAITLNGHLIPTFLFKKKDIMIEKTDHRFGLFFLRKKVHLYYTDTNEGFILQHDKKRFFTLMGEGLKLSYQLLKEKKSLMHAYHDRYDYLTSKEYWEKEFKLGGEK